MRQPDDHDTKEEIAFHEGNSGIEITPPANSGNGQEARAAESEVNKIQQATRWVTSDGKEFAYFSGAEYHAQQMDKAAKANAVLADEKKLSAHLQTEIDRLIAADNQNDSELNLAWGECDKQDAEIKFLQADRERLAQENNRLEMEIETTWEKCGASELLLEQSTRQNARLLEKIRNLEAIDA
jgi:chromosome segregation ATPase